MNTVSFVAVDWGTTSFRLWALATDDTVVAKTSGPFGMSSLKRSDFGTVLEESLNNLGIGTEVPVVICGMAGAAQGWCEAPYLRAPTNLDTLGSYAVKVRGISRDVHILPGVMQTKPANVMRGEETQIMGFLSSNPDFEGIVCLPGTHAKWVKVENNQIVEFTTCMTGEMFSLMSNSSVLQHSMIVEGWDENAFLEAVETAVHSPHLISASFFDLRAEMLLENLSAAAARARLSGLLIGFELAATRSLWNPFSVVLIGAEPLCKNYAQALDTQGVTVQIVNNSQMTLAGLAAANRTIREVRK